ncbi:hypothetical protein [Massilia sp. METH4]|uniref:hypothetical protein n=1 Tax=Massilia sp. METH4 TaxID=3123041 RepID=UPI0030D35D4A
MMTKIVDHGVARGFDSQQINLAVKAAFIESSMGMPNAMATRPGTSHVGLYQYDPVTWKTQNHNGSITSVDSQIEAFYDDIIYYTGRYNSLTSAQRGNLPLDEYIYVKHHDGRNYTDFSGAPGLGIYRGTCFQPELHVNESGGEPPPGHPNPNAPYLYWWSPAITDKTGKVTVRNVEPLAAAPTDDGDGYS